MSDGQGWQTVDLDDGLLTLAAAPAIRVVRDGEVIAQGAPACCVIHSRPGPEGVDQRGVALVPDPDAPGLNARRQEWMRAGLASMAERGEPGTTYPLRAGDVLQIPQ